MKQINIRNITFHSNEAEKHKKHNKITERGGGEKEVKHNFKTFKDSNRDIRTELDNNTLPKYTTRLSLGK